MVIDKQWIENVRMEIQQQARDHAMQTKGAMVVIEAMMKQLDEPEPPADVEPAEG